MLLPFEPPYAWAPMLAFLTKRAIQGLETVDAAGTYSRVVHGGSVTVRFTPKGLQVDLSDDALADEAKARLTHLFDLDARPRTINAHFRRDPVLAPLIAKHPGLRVPGNWDVFELAVRAILGQQVTVDAARSLGGMLVARYGEPQAQGKLAFPTAERLANEPGISLPMPKARAATIHALAKAVVDDPTLLAKTDTSIARLCALPGLGEWTANYIALRGLKDPDAFPATDVGLMRAMSVKGIRPSAKALLAKAEAWRPYRAYAAQHLWTADAS
jgi:3-methyladenine DNA glycosylase/8-oxoguanine DNA glycosylase